MYKAIRDGSRFDIWTSTLIVVSYALPGFLVAIFLIIFFAGGSYLDWFPLRVWALPRQVITRRCTSRVPTTPSGEGRRGEPFAALAIELVSESQRLHVVGHVSPFGMEPAVRSRCSFRVCSAPRTRPSLLCSLPAAPRSLARSLARDRIISD